jgi:hypothetical protein
MQQRGGRLVGHACVAVGRTGSHALEQRQYGTHPGFAIQRGDEVHLTGAGVGEADLDAGIGQGFQQGLSAVGHERSPWMINRNRRAVPDGAREFLHTSRRPCSWPAGATVT